MKRFLPAIFCVALLAPTLSAFAPGKDKDKTFSAFFAHKKIWKTKKWNFLKFGIHFKQISSEVTYGSSKNQDVNAKSYAILEGISDATYQSITDNFQAKFKKRMLDDLGIEVNFWNAVKSFEGAAKVLEKEDPKQYSNKGTGAAVVFTADKGPYYKRVGGFPPGGKKLPKEMEAASAELDLHIDFAAFETTISTNKDWGWDVITTTTTVDQGVRAGVFVTPGSNVGAMDQTGYLMAAPLFTLIPSTQPYSSGIESHANEIPEGMAKKFSLTKFAKVATFVVKADEEKYKKAVEEALDTYLDKLIAKIKLERGDQ